MGESISPKGGALKRLLSSPFFLIAIIAFFLPFFSVQCSSGGFGGLTEGLGDLGEGLGEFGEEVPDLGQLQSGELAKVTGVQLVTGQAEDDLRESAEQSAQGELAPTPAPGAEQDVDLGIVQILAIAAAAAAVLGLLLSLLGGRAGGAIALVIGALGALLLFVLASQFENAVVPDEAGALLVVKNEIGYWLALAGFGIAAITGVIRILMPDRPAVAGWAAPADVPPAEPPPPEAPPSP